MTMTATTTRTLDVPGATVTYDVRHNESSTEPALFLIGSPMGAAGFGSLAGHFTDRTIVTYDPRGSERSTKPDLTSPSTPEEHADDLHRVIQDLGGGPVDLFASSGGATNALALVARHPEDVRTLVTHEPPIASVLPDHENALAAARAVHETYRRSGFGAGMAHFIAVVSHQGEFPDDFAQRPAPDPAMFGMPTEDDGSRTDPLMGQNIISGTRYEPDFDALRAATTRIVIAAGVESAGILPSRAAFAIAERLGTRAGHLPERPRRIPRRRIWPDGRARSFRGHAARGAGVRRPDHGKAHLPPERLAGRLRRDAGPRPRVGDRRRGAPHLVQQPDASGGRVAVRASAVRADGGILADRRGGSLRDRCGAGVRAHLEAMPKIVFSTSLERVEHNSRLVQGDVASVLADVRREFDGDLGVGGPNLAAQFVRRGLVDEYRLVIHPVVLGAGTPFWPGLEAPLPLRLVEQRTFDSGCRVQVVRSVVARSIFGRVGLQVDERRTLLSNPGMDREAP